MNKNRRKGDEKLVIEVTCWVQYGEKIPKFRMESWHMTYACCGSCWWRCGVISLCSSQWRHKCKCFKVKYVMLTNSKRICSRHTFFLFIFSIWMFCLVKMYTYRRGSSRWDGISTGKKRNNPESFQTINGYG